jgi:hypothetical protein
MTGYNFNQKTNPKTIRRYSYLIAGYIVADVNTTTLYTNYPSQADANNPTFIVQGSRSFTAFSCSDHSVTATFDLAQAGTSYYQRFNVVNSHGKSAGQTIVLPQFDFMYNNKSSSVAVAFYDNQLMGNITPTDIGAATKANVPSVIIGSANFDQGSLLKVLGNAVLTLNTYYTKLANQHNMRVADIVNQITYDMQQKNSTEVSLAVFFAE